MSLGETIHRLRTEQNLSQDGLCLLYTSDAADD